MTEECGDGIDNNCNGQIDEDCTCIDSDGDTVCDTEDVCEGFDDLADADADEIPDGCDLCFGDNATGDIDNDGICDSDDGCPEDANKSEPGDCGCGIADTDSDGDFTPDCNDGCPDDLIKLNLEIVVAVLQTQILMVMEHQIVLITVLTDKIRNREFVVVEIPIMILMEMLFPIVMIIVLTI